MMPTHPLLSDQTPDGELSDPYVPRMTPDELAPAAPATIGDTGVDGAVLLDLALKAAYTVPQFATEWAARRLNLPQPLVSELLEQLRGDHLLEILGQAGPFGYRYSISQRGRERANRLLEVSGYIGPAPVALEAYTALLEWQLAHSPPVTPERVSAVLTNLVLTPQAEQLAGLAASSGRSLFLFGPPGNGKTALSRLLHNALRGDLWIPHCIALDSQIIRVFDPQVHQEVPLETDEPWLIDHRWVRVRRPLVVVGGEATLDSFDLAYSAGLRYYEAPLHVKANGGTFLIDDFGRQRVDPHELLNRWIIPLEHQVDYLTLHTGQKIQVPFRLLLLVATNLDLDAVTDPAFLRRMGYRLQLKPPSPEQYRVIFERSAAQLGVALAPGLLAGLLARYQAEQRELRCCEPRDLLARIQDICRFQGWPLAVSEELLDVAWAGYFGPAQAGTAR